MIIDLGRNFDGRCALCGEPIHPGSHYRDASGELRPDVPHTLVHANPQGREIPCAQLVPATDGKAA